MKQIHNILLAAIAMLSVSLGAYAQLSVTFTWDNPGSVNLFVGGSGESNKADIPSGATSYIASLPNTWGTTYVGAAPGYMIESVVADGNSLSPMYNGLYSVDMSKYNGKSVAVKSEKIVYDGTINVDVINGREALTTTFWGTNREVRLKTGVQSIPYSTKYETGIDIQAKVVGSSDPYIKQGDEQLIEKEWSAPYSWSSMLVHKYQGTSTTGFGFDEGTNFEIKWCDTPDPEETPTHSVSLSYADAASRSAVTMIFNVTKMKSIAERDIFSVDEGDVVRIMFNTLDYDVTINDTPLTPEGEATPYLITVADDMSLAIAVAERAYGTTEVIFAVADIDGIEIREGAYNGPVFDKSLLTEGETIDYTYIGSDTLEKTAELTLYTATVSLKSPKLYIYELPGYWIEVNEYRYGADIIPTIVATTDYTLNVVDHKIAADTKIVVYISTDGVKATVSDVSIRDRNHKSYPLKAGYNEFEVDRAYVTPLSVTAFNLDEGVAMAVFNDMSKVTKSDDNGAFACNITGDGVIHIFAGKPVQAQQTISVTIDPDIDDATVTVDRIHPLAGSGSVTTFKGCEIAVTPGGNKYTLDGEIPEYEGDTHIFKASANHNVTIGKSSGIINATADSIGNCDVIDLNGRVVLRNATPEAINALKCGIYVIGDKKVMVAK